jgi:hypothetical protein
VFGAYTRLTPVVDAQQKILSEQFIDSIIHDITAELIHFRKQFDQVWKNGYSAELPEDKNQFLQAKNNRIKKKFSNQFLSQYPLGQCFHLTSTVVEFIEEFELQNENSIFYTVKSFIDNGGIFKKIWGVYNNDHFQTAIQIGNWYIDIAADTFEIQEKQVEFCLFNDSKFSPVTSIEQYNSILENTENKKLYLNTIFPNLWPYFPFFIKNNAKNIYSIPDSKYLSGLCTKDNFHLLKDYLLNPHSEGISNESRNLILGKFSDKKEKYIQKNFLEISDLTKDDLFSYLKTSGLNKADTLKAVNYINFILKSKSF